MKLNFWQWLGLVLLIIGLAMYVYRAKQATPAPGQPSTQTSN